MSSVPLDLPLHEPIRDSRVRAAFEAVPRELFVAPETRNRAYDDCALPIGHGQTISQPYMIAVMLEALALRGDERVLEVGSGSGYVVALLLHLAREVAGIERIGALVDQSRVALRAAGLYDDAVDAGRLHLREGDGTLGWPELAPFDAILVSAGAPSLPRSLLGQLAPGGRLVIPVGSHTRGMRLTVAQRPIDSADREWRPILSDGLTCAFVPLIGREGFTE